MNPVVEAFVTADLLGKGIFLTLFVLSVATWALALHKFSLYRRVAKEGAEFLVQLRGGAKHQTFSPSHPLALLYADYLRSKREKWALEHLLLSTQATERKNLEAGLFLLPTVASLAPFLGLLGTVWGILLTFHELQHGGSTLASTAVMGGLATALGTTVVGIIVAVPALVSYNYLRAQVRHFCFDMDGFSQTLLASQDQNE